MKRALGLFLTTAIAGCVGGGGEGFGNSGDGDADADADGDSDGDVPRLYPEAPYWNPGDPPGDILADMEFPGNGSDDTISFGELFDSYPTNKEVLVYHLCVS